MASGYGLDGGPSRCFPFWQEMLACYVVNSTKENPQNVAKCQPAMEDYYECLHHKKEYLKVTAMQQEHVRRVLKEGDKRTQGTDIRTLGLIPGQKPEDVHMHPLPLIPHRGPSIT